MLSLESCISTLAGYGFLLNGANKYKCGNQHKIQDPDHFFFYCIHGCIFFWQNMNCAIFFLRAFPMQKIAGK